MNKKKRGSDFNNVYISSYTVSLLLPNKYMI